MISVRFHVDNSNLERGDASLLNNIGNELGDIADNVVDYIRSNWSPVSPSEPGKPPAVVTGALDASIRADKTGRDVLGRFAGRENTTAWFVRAGDKTAWYAADLEEGRESTNLLPRPFIEPALEAIGKDMDNSIRASFKRSFR